jgi:hypothetical protein
VVEDEFERTGVLVIRVLKRVGSSLLRARITGRRDILADEETTVMVVGAEKAAKAVHDWLVAFERDDEYGGGSASGER